MKTRQRTCVIVVLLSFAFPSIYSQQSFDVEAYKRFLLSNQNLGGVQLEASHPLGIFEASTSVPTSQPAYFDSIDRKFGLTADEKQLLTRNGFIVTERNSYSSFGAAFLDIYHSDLPVFITTDAILHAVHMSYDAILMSVEQASLQPQLESLLERLGAQQPILESRYGANPRMQPMLQDFDVYITVPLILLGSNKIPYYPENDAFVADLLTCIKNQRPAMVPLFSDERRIVDFSQFTVRGHYTQSAELSRYFQAMMWLGRTEIYLIAPESDDPQQTSASIQRQTIDAALVAEAVAGAGAHALLDTIDNTIRFFVGESDNVTLGNVEWLLADCGIQRSDEFLDNVKLQDFQNLLVRQSYAFQSINSQILYSNPFSPDQIRPASAFLLLGQRFIIDSYVTGNVVYDRILYQGTKVRRMLPSPLDVLFALGNDAAVQILQPELERYPYASNLAALRYLVDSYEPAFWRSTLFNAWLQMIRTLNPPAARAGLPSFMQTAAWWQEKMNTQLASWAQARHDVLLYAKQSYSGGIICSYPEGYVEPIPEFYDALRTFAEIALANLGSSARIQQYFSQLACTADTLGMIARKELSDAALGELEKGFLKKVLFDIPEGCGVSYDGWYCRLFYKGADDLLKRDLVIADIHTAPTDQAGGFIGWVLHVGTGPVNLAVLTAETPGGAYCSYAGPVMSFYQHLSTNFKRLTDEEWLTLYGVAPSLRPSFVNVYLANTTGLSRGEGPTLTTGISDKPQPTLPKSVVLGRNFPNPFNATTIIPFTIPEQSAYSPVVLTVYNLEGQLMTRLLNEELPEGNYTTRWDGTAGNGKPAASGVYFYVLTVGAQRAVGKMTLLK
ncbi:MAG: DUF3160 domain-containing protein [Bacteroidota bacterium]